MSNKYFVRRKWKHSFIADTKLQIDQLKSKIVKVQKAIVELKIQFFYLST